MGNRDEQQRSQWQPPLNLPVSKAPRRPPTPASSQPPAPREPARPTPPPAGRGGGQFRPLLPRFGPKAGEIAPDQSDEEPAVEGNWEERFLARHDPDHSAKTPARSREVEDSRSFDVDEISAARSWDERRYAEVPPARSSGGGRRSRYADEDDYEDRRPARQRDPWSRDWAEWSSTNLPVEDDFDEGNLSRDAFGWQPEGYTMDSVAVRLEPVPPPARANKKARAFKQLRMWVGHGFNKKYQPTRKAINVLLLFSLLGTLLLTTAGAGVTAYVDYTSLKGLATDAVSAFGKLGVDLGLSKGGAVAAINGTADARYLASKTDVDRAMYDFQQLHARLAHPDPILAMANNIAKIHLIMQSGIVLSSVAIDGVAMLQTLLPDLISLANIVNASPIATSSTTDNSALLDGSKLSAIVNDLKTIQPTLQDMIGLVRSTPPATLVAALSTKQQGEILPFLNLLPQAPGALAIMREFLSLPSAGNLLGVGTPVAYLLMTLDNSEIRPVGGFQGQYAVFSVNGGRIGHISLEDVYHHLEPISLSTSTTQDYATYPNLPLTSLEPWFPNSLGWAMRNSGLSPDFKQSAQYALWYLHNESLCELKNPNYVTTNPCNCASNYFGVPHQDAYETCIVGGDRIPTIDAKGQISNYSAQQARMAGVIVIQETVIAQLLNVTGPIYLGCPYNVKVNGKDVPLKVDAAHLQAYIHYFQETYAGRQIGMRNCGAQISDSTKRFTALVSQALQTKLKSLPKTQLIAFAGDLIQDLHTKNIQLYFTDPTKNQANEGPNADLRTIYPEDTSAENFLRKYQISNEFYQGGADPNHPDDSLGMNRSDVSGWKLEPFVHIKLIDQITLDKQGTATHHFQAQYTFTIPSIQLSLDANGNPTPADLQKIFGTVYNAAYGYHYYELWRVYTSPNAILSSSSPGYFNQVSAAQADIFDRAYFLGQYHYFWSVDPATKMVVWTKDPNFTDPSLGWSVPGAVKHCVYTLHVQPQSGVNASMDITVMGPHGNLLGTLSGSLAQNQVLTVKAC